MGTEFRLSEYLREIEVNQLWNSYTDATNHIGSRNKKKLELDRLLKLATGEGLETPALSERTRLNAVLMSVVPSYRRVCPPPPPPPSPDLASKYDLPLHGGHSNNPIFDPDYECEIAEFALRREIKKKGSQLAELINVRNQACQGGFIVRGKDVAKKSDDEMGDQDEQRKDSTTMKDALQIAQDTMKLVRGTFEVRFRVNFRPTMTGPASICGS